MRIFGVNLVNSKIQRQTLPLSLQEYADSFTYASHQYPLFGYGPSYPNEKLEEISHNFRSYVGGGYMSNVVVFACVLSRMQLFSEARFQFRQRRSGRPGDLFGSQALAVLEEPEPNKTTGDLLSRMETDVSLAGNWYGVRDGQTIKRLRPDWVAIALTADDEDPDATLAGYVYFPGGPHSGKRPIAYLPNEVAHYAPIPDPLARYRGMSWLSPAIREIMADSGFRDHKIKFVERGGARNFLFQIDKTAMTSDQFKDFVGDYRRLYEQGDAAGRSIFLRAGVDATPLGSEFGTQGMDLKKIVGAGETRIAAAAGVPPIVVGLSEGLEAATYSNYGQARRRFADNTMRPLWRNAAASLSAIIDVPDGSELWYDDRDIPALQEDMKERAEVQESEARSMRQLLDGGYEPDSIVDAITAGDWKRLKHTGKLSVQLQEPGTPETNGKPVTDVLVPKV